MEHLAQRLLRKLRERHFARIARGVLATPPVRARDDGVILFSMIGTRVVAPYLIAAKSFHAQLGRGRFVILDDGTLTPADRAVLARHLDHPEIRPIAAVSPGDCPRGSCWERLLVLLELRRTHYVIQLDSDTVTVGPVDEVAAAIAAGRSFTLRGDASAELQDAAHFAGDPAAMPPTSHVQALIEAGLHRIDAGLPRPLRYVRGCAGFAGFAPGGRGREVADAFSREARALLGAAKWAEWGSEQVMSNVIVANEPDPLLLPYARYMNYWAERALGPVSLVHFLGTHRYDRGCYPRVARAAIARLAGTD
ncbi:hypothetical protein ACFOON_02630 [Novosphingobium piscinae]|uniref:Uncharacterized protein n=1 Tax=Novosphingobium piscinae TaxID=1507448 RepID=A0A7X1G128_9SPHN|nr:hypothetical protein [Novosphingobium piscinae]MBC2670699.1 hypothetical protein [Novosphingobium piscinae]